MWAAGLSRRAIMARWMVIGVCSLEKKEKKDDKKKDAKKDEKKEEEPPKKKQKGDCDKGRKFVRRCDLPLYDDPECPKCLTKEKQQELREKQQNCSLVFNTISCMRKEVWMLSDKLEELYEEFGVYLDEAEKKFWELYEILRKEENLHYRIDLITAGAFAGLYFARKRCNNFVRFLYMLTGALIAAAICYPDEAKEVIKWIYEHVMMLYLWINCDEESGTCDEVFGKKRPDESLKGRGEEEEDDAPRAAVIPHASLPPYCITPRLMPEEEPPEPSPCPSLS